MESASFREELLGAQKELLQLANLLTTDCDDANDLVQETLLKALSNEEKYTPNSNIKGWMYAIMKNIFINNYRKVLREQTYQYTDCDAYSLEIPSIESFSSIDNEYDRKEMRQVIQTLPKEYRIPLCMHISGFKYLDISEKLHVPIGTVKSRLFIAKKKLKKELKDFR